MKELALAHRSFTKRHNEVLLVLANRRIVVVVRALLRIVACIGIIFELDLIPLQQPVSLVLLSVCAHLSHKALLQSEEVLLPLLCACQLVRFDSSLRKIVKIVCLIEKPWGKILCVKDAHFLLVHQHENDALCQEKTLVNRVLADVETIVLEGGRLLVFGRVYVKS